jgi:hypothetical protein
MLVTGKGSGGSWQIRGEQLGSAMGARVIANAPPEEIEKADSIYLVKRPTQAIIERKTGVPLVWDIVDAWPQPEGNSWKRWQVIAHIMQTASRIKPDYLLAATQKMAEDLGPDAYALRHHGRTYYSQNVIREKVSVVAYEGSAKYLGRWVEKITAECVRRGWVFVVNPKDLTEVDIILALRDFPYKGYATDCWKSNVKLQNAQNSGTPIICAREAGYQETASGGEEWADTPEELVRAFDKLTGQAERLVAASLLRRQAYHAIDAARDFAKWRAGKF